MTSEGDSNPATPGPKKSALSTTDAPQQLFPIFRKRPKRKISNANSPHDSSSTHNPPITRVHQTNHSSSQNPHHNNSNPNNNKDSHPNNLSDSSSAAPALTTTEKTSTTIMTTTTPTSETTTTTTHLNYNPINPAHVKLRRRSLAISAIPSPRIATWNCNSLSHYTTTSSGINRRNNIIENINHLKKQHDIICLQETHLGPKEDRALTSTLKGWEIFYSNHNLPPLHRAGTIIAVSPRYRALYKLTHHNLYRGHTHSVTFDPLPYGPHLKPFQVINFYLSTAVRNHSALKRDQIRSTLSLPNNIHTFALGDLNFVEHPEDTTGSSDLTLDTATQTAWDAFAAHFSLREVRQPVHTCYSLTYGKGATKSCSSNLDRFYTSHSEADLAVLDFTAHLPKLPHTSLAAHKAKRAGVYGSSASDHYAVSLNARSSAPNTRDFKMGFEISK